MTRRTFSAATAAITFKLAPKSAAQQTSTTKAAPVKMGFIGIGIRGMYLLEQFQKLPGVIPVITADVYDGHLTRAKEVTNGAIETTRDYRRVLDRKDLDAVVIATPDHWHAKMTLEAIAAGKHIYLEKPMAWSIEQNLQIVRAMEGNRKCLMVGSEGKTSAITQKAREIVKSGVLGHVNMVRMANTRNSPEGAWVYAVAPDASPATIDWARFIGPAPKRDFDPKVFFRWRCWWEYSGGVATDLFVHMLTQLHEVMDVPAPVSVVSQGGIYRWKDGRSVPDVMNSVYEYPGEFVADLYVNLGNSSGERGMLIMGSKGTLTVGMRSLTLRAEANLPDVQRYGTAAWPDKMRAEYFESRGHSADGRPKKALPPMPKAEEILVDRGTSHLEHFLISVREGAPSKENAWDGHAAASSAHLANLAYQQGRRLKWDWKTGLIS
ncbi:MAG: Gfo/Idh/MocA family oxidoreductase [Bryobacterales bacterium]|nr:Gfo/Idh/MocA family oxidoreductase [Bryobacterales bacterium]